MADGSQLVDSGSSGAPDAPTGDVVSLKVRVFGRGTVDSIPAGLVCESNVCKGTFPRGTTVALHARAATDGVFSGWLGACARAGECSVTLDAEHDVIARFGVPVATYARGFGSTSYGGAHALAADGAGGVWVASSFSNWAEIDTPIESLGHDDALFSHVLADGSVDVAIRVGGIGDDIGTAIAVLPGGDVVVGGSCHETVDFGDGPITSSFAGFDGFVARYTATGALVWARRWANLSSQSVDALTVTANGDVVVVGTSQSVADGTIDLGGGPVLTPLGAASDGFVARYRGSDGAFIAASMIGGAEADEVNAVAKLGTDLIVTGRFQHTATFGGTTLESPDNDALFVARLAPDMTAIWATLVDEGEYGGALPGLAIDGQDIYVSGELGHPEDARRFGVFARLSGDGATVWSKRLGDGAQGELYSHGLARIGGKSIVAGMYTAGVALDVPASDGMGFFLAAFDDDGESLWMRGFPSPVDGWVFPRAVGRGPGTDDIVVAGEVLGPFDLGPAFIGFEVVHGSRGFASSFVVTDDSI